MIDTAEIGEFLPGAGQFAQTREEYIRTLEVALQLLQREVENLRQQRRSVGDVSLYKGGGSTVAAQFALEFA